MNQFYFISRAGLLCFAFLALQLRAPALELPRDSATMALSIIKEQRGKKISQNIVSVRGHRGQNQPVEWEISSLVGDGQRVFVVKNKKIIADTIYSSGRGIVVDLRRLKVDSPDVFTLANAAALKENVGFDSVDYELSAAPLGNSPQWVIFLRDFKGRDVGRLVISGNASKILTREWFAPRESVRQPIGPDDASVKIALRSYNPGERGVSARRDKQGGVKGMARFTGRKLKDGFLNLGNRINNAFSNQESVSLQKSRHQIPKTSRKNKAR